MNFTRALSASIFNALLHSKQSQPKSSTLQSIRTYLTPCTQYAKDSKPCLDIKDVEIVWGESCHYDEIKSFLFNEFWPREPTIQSLWLNYGCSKYVDALTDKYCLSGDRLLALEKIKGTNETKLVGFLAGYKVYPWIADEYERWGHATDDAATRNRLFFRAHCIKSPNLFDKCKINHYYEIEVLATAKDVSGLGLGTKMLNTALQHASIMHPRTVLAATGLYSQKVCEKCDMKKEWEIEYDDCTDTRGKRMFCPRSPHYTCAVYGRENTS